MRKVIVIIFSLVIISALFVTPTFAHIIVTPSTIGIAKTQDFTVNVPNEKDNPVVAVKLLIPNGVNNVIPNEVFGWNINTVTNGSGDTATVSEIDWTDGSIPPGQRAEFIFQAQVPSNVTTLPWKAYQTYSDGTVMSWDIDPVKLRTLSDTQQDQLADKENKGTYSTTKVINDLAIPANASVTQVQEVDQKATTALVFSIIAIAISCVALSIARRKNPQNTFSKLSTKPSRSRKKSQ